MESSTLQPAMHVLICKCKCAFKMRDSITSVTVMVTLFCISFFKHAMDGGLAKTLLVYCYKIAKSWWHSQLLVLIESNSWPFSFYLFASVVVKHEVINLDSTAQKIAIVVSHREAVGNGFSAPSYFLQRKSILLAYHKHGLDILLCTVRTAEVFQKLY